ncbi:MAG: hypothetical protein LHV68_08055 [Elusimicrobia bacterium]|nr:hypothetical protein [Candidatus Liberimonas magnetica]
MKQKIAGILLIIVSLTLYGCAGGRIKLSSDTAHVNNVYSSIRKMLEHGDTVCVRVSYKSSFKGLPEDETPEDYGCETDPKTIVETEKYLLLEAFSKFPNFSVVDRTTLDETYNEMKLSMDGATSSNLEPGQIKSATHLLLIDSKDYFITSNDETTDNFFEVKKLMDLKKNVLIAMNKFAESRVVHLIFEEDDSRDSDEEEPRYSVLISGPSMPGKTEQESDNNAPYTPPQSQLKENEMISITGIRPSDSDPAASNNTDTSSDAMKVPNWPIARVIRQSYPEFSGQSDSYVVKHFITSHPGYTRRITPESHPESQFHGNLPKYGPSQFFKQ